MEYVAQKRSVALTFQWWLANGAIYGLKEGAVAKKQRLESKQLTHLLGDGVNVVVGEGNDA